MLGFQKTIRHLDGHTVEVKSSGVTQPFSWQILKEEGMPIRGTGEYGELHVKMIVNFPSKLSPRQIEIVQKIFSHSNKQEKVSSDEL